MPGSKPAPTAGRKRQRAIIWSSAIAAIVLVGGIASACDPNTSPPSQPADNIVTVTSTTAPETTVAPVTTAAPVTVAPVTTIPAPPPVTEAPQEPATQAAPPPAGNGTDCGSDSYLNSSGNCVHDPVTANGPPAGATAKCNDGTYSFSQHHSGTCSGHHGVAEWLN
jgi:hypothetical protein